MLSRENNELLTRVGPDTPMGEMFRRYWVPALLSEEIPEPNCPPVRVRLLGEDLVAFRDTEGRIGLIDEYCSHRQTSLFYGRNEECGLRCIYHGWKYDFEGKIVETPAEPPGSTLKDYVQHKAYPSHEAAGVVFAYMGPKEKKPLFPNLDWFSVPSTHVGVSKFFLENNYLQAIEGDCDTSHVGYLHLGNRTSGGDIAEIGARDRAPRFENEITWCGIRSAASRNIGEGMKSVDVFSYIMPFIACVPAGKKSNGKLDGYLIVYQTPADDYHTWRYNFRFKRSEPVTQEELERDRCQIDSDYRLIANRRNNYLIDRLKQRTVNYSGMEGFTTQDACITEGMGPIVDRTKEHLGASDGYIVAVRLFLLKAVNDFQRGIDPPGLVWDPSNNDFSAARCTSVRVETEASWKEAEQRIYGMT